MHQPLPAIRNRFSQNDPDQGRAHQLEQEEIFHSDQVGEGEQQGQNSQQPRQAPARPPQSQQRAQQGSQKSRQDNEKMAVHQADELLFKTRVNHKQQSGPDSCVSLTRPDQAKQPPQGHPSRPTPVEGKHLPAPGQAAQQGGGHPKNHSPIRPVGGEIARQPGRAQTGGDPVDRPIIPIETQARDQQGIAGQAGQQQRQRGRPGGQRNGRNTLEKPIHQHLRPQAAVNPLQGPWQPTCGG